MRTSLSVYLCACARVCTASVCLHARMSACIGVFVRVCVRMNENSNPKLKDAHGLIARALCEPITFERDPSA
jgi:hypothetical protein